MDRLTKPTKAEIREHGKLLGYCCLCQEFVCENDVVMNPDNPDQKPLLIQHKVPEDWKVAFGGAPIVFLCCRHPSACTAAYEGKRAKDELAPEKFIDEAFSTTLSSNASVLKALTGRLQLPTAADKSKQARVPKEAAVATTDGSHAAASSPEAAAEASSMTATSTQEAAKEAKVLPQLKGAAQGVEQAKGGEGDSASSVPAAADADPPASQPGAATEATGKTAPSTQEAAEEPELPPQLTEAAEGEEQTTFKDDESDGRGWNPLAMESPGELNAFLDADALGKAWQELIGNDPKDFFDETTVLNTLRKNQEFLNRVEATWPELFVEKDLEFLLNIVNKLKVGELTLLSSEAILQSLEVPAEDQVKGEVEKKPLEAVAASEAKKHVVDLEEEPVWDLNSARKFTFDEMAAIINSGKDKEEIIENCSVGGSDFADLWAENKGKSVPKLVPSLSSSIALLAVKEVPLSLDRRAPTAVPRIILTSKLVTATVLHVAPRTRCAARPTPQLTTRHPSLAVDALSRCLTGPSVDNLEGNRRLSCQRWLHTLSTRSPQSSTWTSCDRIRHRSSG